MNKKNYHFYLLTFFWIIVQTYLLVNNGINTNGEAKRIIREANFLINGTHFSNIIYFSYLTEILLVYIKLKFAIGYEFIIAIQLLVNLIALRFFFSYCSFLFESKNLAFIGSLLLVVCYPYQHYNSSLYTESLFFSLSIIYSCTLLRTKKITALRVFYLISLLLLLCLTRPTGLFFILSTVIYLFIILYKFIKIHRISYWGILFCIAIFSLYILNFAMGTGGGIDIIRPLREGHIICDVPTILTAIQIKTNACNNSIYGLLAYVLNNFQQFLIFAWAKSIAFFGLQRHYYSIYHNIFLSVYFYPLYILILISFIRFGKKIPLSFVYFFSVIGLFWSLVIFSCDEWHNRFFLTLVPYLIIPALYFFSSKKKTT